MIVHVTVRVSDGPTEIFGLIPSSANVATFDAVVEVEFKSTEPRIFEV